MPRHPSLLLPLIATLAIAGCRADDSPSTASPSPAAASEAQTPDATRTPSPEPQGSSQDTVVRFTRGGTSVDVTIGEEHVATRDFLSMLPLKLTLEEFNGREKIGDLPRELDVDGAPGSDPENGDLIYFVPWGNLGFYYNTSGIGYSDDTINLGTYRASEEQLSRLEGGEVTVEIVE